MKNNISYPPLLNLQIFNHEPISKIGWRLILLERHSFYLSCNFIYFFRFLKKYFFQLNTSPLFFRMKDDFWKMIWNWYCPILISFLMIEHRKVFSFVNSNNSISLQKQICLSKRKKYIIFKLFNKILSLASTKCSKLCICIFKCLNC